MTKVINLFGGPGTGKSTTAAATFAEMKYRGINCELVTEYAKDVVWGRTTATLDNQLYVFAKQHHRFFRLLGQVDYIVTDSPLFLMMYYGRKQGNSYLNLVMEEVHKLPGFNFFLKRVKDFNPAGRLQTEDEAKAIDGQLLALLTAYNLPYITVTADRDAAHKIVDYVLADGVG